MKFDHVLIATDFSEDAKRACEYVSAKLAGSNEQISLLTVVPDWQVPFTLYEFVPDPALVDSYRKEIVASAMKRVEEAAQSMFKGHKVNAVAKLSDRVISEEIVDFANAHGCDCIVMGSHGSGAVGALVMGSVTQRVIRHAKCPVLVLPREKR